jgi:hypothetical protein
MAETHLLRARRRGGEHRAEAWVLAGVVVAATVSAVQVVRWLAERFEVQTQWPTLVVAGGLACWAPRAFGVTLGSSAWRRPEEQAAVLLVGDVVALFRMIGGSVPWAGRPVWIAVPVVEGLLPGGFCVTALLWVFRRGFAAGTSVRPAILVDSLELIAQGALQSRTGEVGAPTLSLLRRPALGRSVRSWAHRHRPGRRGHAALGRATPQQGHPRRCPASAVLPTRLVVCGSYRAPPPAGRAAAAGRRTVPGAPAPHTGRDDQP